MNWLRRKLVAWLLPEIAAQQAGKFDVKMSVSAEAGLVHASELQRFLRDIQRRAA